MAGNLFKSRANYVFDYKPRFYDERKERLKNLAEKYTTEKKEESKSQKTTLLISNLKKEWKRNKHVAYDKKANRRIAIIITVLVGILTYIFDLHKIL
ncbi:MAG: hypothetical protein L3J23_06030 [Flavobacteriaceae bacterium]|nr:hypothetical protein [Flavobacteriaceae bacterium]